MSASILPVCPDGIPAELRAIPRWVVWRVESPDGRSAPTKVPYQVNGIRKALPNDPSTCGSFAAAMKRYEAGGWAGIGFLLGDGIAGIDYDGCRDPETGRIDGWARKHLDRLPSYTEVSPTGSGVKTIVYGK